MNHYHAVIARADGAQPNLQITIEAETLEQATALFDAKYGNATVRKVWQDYFETHLPV
jgi:hypothetical protein